MSVSISPNSQTRWLRVLQERRWYGRSGTEHHHEYHLFMQTQTTAVSFTLYSAAQWSAAWKMFCFYRRFGSFGLWSQCCRHWMLQTNDWKLWRCWSSDYIVCVPVYFLCFTFLPLYILYVCIPTAALFLSSLWGSCSVSLFLWLFLLVFFFTRPNYILISVFLCGHLGFKFGRCFWFFSFCSAVRELLIL